MDLSSEAIKSRSWFPIVQSSTIILPKLLAVLGPPLSINRSRTSSEQQAKCSASSFLHYLRAFV